MPLIKSSSRGAVSSNIKTLIHENKPQRQAVAIALDIARRAKRATGGETSTTPWFVRNEARTITHGPAIGAGMGKTIGPLVTKGNLAAATPLGQALANSPKVSAVKPNFPKLPKPPNLKPAKLTMKGGGEVNKTISPGPLLDPTPGRSDKINGKVEDGAYILPADCVSACGENSSLAGHAFIEHMISKLPKVKSNAKKDGGKTEYSKKPVPVALSGGEHILGRDVVERIGGGDYEKGRRILDHFVMHIRHRNIESLKKLPPPADD